MKVNVTVSQFRALSIAQRLRLQLKSISSHVTVDFAN
jgi:hypothetical protein